MFSDDFLGLMRFLYTSKDSVAVLLEIYRFVIFARKVVGEQVASGYSPTKEG